VKLTQFTDYGLRALMIPGSNQEQSFSSKELSDILQISHEHLVKILQRLSQRGYVQSQRGAGGGFRLFIDAKKIPIDRLVRYVCKAHTGQPGGENRVSHPPISQN
jgi:Rrf2 family nitric oxide-sensitive transcriptional repressor